MILLKFILFADDTTIVAHINTNNMETANIINIKLEKILHISKKKYYIFLRQNCVYSIKYSVKYQFQKYRSEILLLVTQKWKIFLGFRLDGNLNWHNYIEKLSCKLSRTLGIINKLKYVLPRNV